MAPQFSITTTETELSLTLRPNLESRTKADGQRVRDGLITTKMAGSTCSSLTTLNGLHRPINGAAKSGRATVLTVTPATTKGKKPSSITTTTTGLSPM